MVSLRFCKGGTFRAVLAAAVVATSFRMGSSAAAADLEGDAPPLLEQVEEVLASEGHLSADLVEPLTNLALSYQESEDYSLALVAVDRAMQVLRVNRGLHTLEQLPLVWLKLRIEEARENHAAVWALEQELLALARRHPGDLRTAPVFASVADRQMGALEQYMQGGRPPELLYGCYYKQWPNSPDGSCTAGSRKIVVQGMLAEAQRNYSAAIGVLLRSGSFDDAELPALEMKLLRGVDLVRTLSSGDSSVQPIPMVPAYVGASRIEPWRSRIAPVAALDSWPLAHREDAARPALDSKIATNHAHLMSPYHRGRQSLRRLYAYGAASSSPTLEQADALVQIADWDLLYSRNGQAVSSYESARELLELAAIPKADIQTLFAPTTPVVLPAFRPNPLAPQDARRATGHIDVAFEITKYGRGRAVEILGAENATDSDVDELVGIIRKSRFRPRLEAGRLAETALVRVRYQLYPQ